MKTGFSKYVWRETYFCKDKITLGKIQIRIYIDFKYSSLQSMWFKKEKVSMTDIAYEYGCISSIDTLI